LHTTPLYRPARAAMACNNWTHMPG